MPNDTQDVDLNNDVTEPTTTETNVQDDNTASDDQATKVTETPEQKRARLTRQLEQLNKKYPVTEKTDTVEKKPGAQSGDFDYGQKAFLIANGVKGEKETALARDYMVNTGKTLDEVVANKHFLAELKELRDLETTQNATPNGSRRTGNSAQDSVDYWLAKGEMPPANMTELRREYVNRKMKKEENKGKFYNS